MGLIDIEMFATLDLVGQAPGGPEEDTEGFPFGGWQAPLLAEFTGAQINAAYQGTDALLLGRRTYDIFAAYWPHQAGGEDDEIATMQRWLRDRGQPVPEVHRMEDGRVMVHTPGMQHGGGHGHAMHDMPGMLSDEQLASLRAAKAADFDRLFLTLMIQHHKGAVIMVHDLFATDGAGQDEDVFRFASDVQVDQRTEVARMELMLQALPPAEDLQ